MVAPLVDTGCRVAIPLGLLGRRVIAWFPPLRSANPMRQVALNPPRYPSCTTVQQDTYPTHIYCHVGLSTRI